MNAQTEMTDECREAFEVELRHLYPSAIKLRSDDGKYIGHMEVLWKFFQSIWNRRAHLTKPDAGGGYPMKNHNPPNYFGAPPSGVPVEPDHIADAGIMVSQTSAVPMPEPFGYFRCTLDGWIDCAETDEGARPLYEASQLTAYATAKTAEATRELVDGLQNLLNDTQHSEHKCGDIDCPVTNARALIAKYTQTQKESK